MNLGGINPKDSQKVEQTKTEQPSSSIEQRVMNSLTGKADVSSILEAAATDSFKPNANIELQTIITEIAADALAQKPEPKIRGKLSALFPRGIATWTKRS